jgi:PAS domain S-box-containing protein
MSERGQAKSIARSTDKFPYTDRSPEYYKLILESIGEGVHGLDAQGRITLANDAAGQMLGWSRDELVGTPHHRVIHHTRDKRPRNALRAHVHDPRGGRTGSRRRWGTYEELVG